jgi:hypothetical protein
LNSEKIIKDIDQNIFYFRPDISFIALVKKQVAGINDINIISEYFSNFLTNIFEKGKITGQRRERMAMINFYLKDQKNLIKLNNFIKKFDTGLEKIDISTQITKKDHSVEQKVEAKGVRANGKTLD